MLDIRFKQLSDTVKNAVSIGKSVNTLRAELKATKGAAASLICKLYRKFKQVAKRHTMALLPANKQGCFVLHHTDAKSDLLRSLIAEADVYLLSTFETIADEYNAKIIIFGA